MIGDTIATNDLSASTGDLPDATAHVTTLTKVNNDGFASQYRYRGTDYDYVLDIRNTYESVRSDGIKYSRHNAAFALTKRAVIASGILTPSIPYVCNITFRLPSTGDVAIATALAGHLAEIIPIHSNGARLLKMFNFES